MPPPVSKLPTAAHKGIINAMVAQVRDLDLPTKDRASRAKIDPTTLMKAGDAIEVFGELVEIQGPGRLVGWIYCYKSDPGPTLMSVHVDQVGPPKIEPPPPVEPFP